PFHLAQVHAASVPSSKRPMQPSEQPADAKRNCDGGIGLLFNGVAQQAFERRSCVAGGSGHVGGTVSRPAVDVLRRAFDLVGDAFSLGLCVARGPSKALLRLAAEIASGTADQILIHDGRSRLRRYPTTILEGLCSRAAEPARRLRRCLYRQRSQKLER